MSLAFVVVLAGCRPGGPDAGDASATDAPRDASIADAVARTDVRADDAVDANGFDARTYSCDEIDGTRPPNGLPCATPGDLCDQNAVCARVTFTCTCSNAFVWDDCMQGASYCPDSAVVGQ